MSPLTEGTLYGVDVSTLGRYVQTGTAISGPANKVTVPDFNGEGNAEEGYFYATHVEPNDGVEVRTNTNPDKWIKLYGGDENGDLLILLGKDAPTMEWYEVKDADGICTRYDVSGITAAATISLSADAPAVKKATARKSTKKTSSKQS